MDGDIGQPALAEEKETMLDSRQDDGVKRDSF